MDVLNAATLSLPFVAVRGYVPVYELPGMTDLRVTVIPAAQLVTAFDLNRRHAFDCQIDVVVQQRAEPTAVLCDPLMDLVEEIIDLFRVAGPLPGTAARNVGVANDTCFDRLELDTKRLFSSVVSLTFRLTR